MMNIVQVAAQEREVDQDVQDEGVRVDDPENPEFYCLWDVKL